MQRVAAGEFRAQPEISRRLSSNVCTTNGNAKATPKRDFYGFSSVNAEAPVTCVNTVLLTSKADHSFAKTRHCALAFPRNAGLEPLTGKSFPLSGPVRHVKPPIKPESFPPSLPLSPWQRPSRFSYTPPDAAHGASRHEPFIAFRASRWALGLLDLEKPSSDKATAWMPDIDFSFAVSAFCC
jgi:hypothetical protein